MSDGGSGVGRNFRTENRERMMSVMGEGVGVAGKTIPFQGWTVAVTTCVPAAR
ncbi:hypothetical protein GCM10023220_13590 [Streptomyces ziwulingensis]|uniref:Uncharacterized protein n=1 Tax=Streptomyces ziwulingensis TaxID=1045501 RepID=A0ABP9B3Z0_9ACTN